MNRRIALRAAAALVSATLTSFAMAEDHFANGRQIKISYQNLTASQPLSNAVFVTHDRSFKLWRVGEAVTFPVSRMAEEGGAGGLLGGVIFPLIGKAVGDLVQTVPTPPGMSRTTDIIVTKEQPLLSVIAMLVLTNDGFAGLDSLNVYELTKPTTIDLYAYDAGSEKNNERSAYLIAMGGGERDPENGVVTRHTGIRGDADAPAAWKFDVAKPVARITLTPAPAP